MSKKKRIYLSGPISGLPRREYLERFAEAERMLRAEGYDVVNPTRFLVCRWPWLYRIVGYHATLCYDLYRLMQCDGIYMLPGWEHSNGARIEDAVAFRFDIYRVFSKKYNEYNEHMRHFIEHSGPNEPKGEKVLTKEEQAQLAELIKGASWPEEMMQKENIEEKSIAHRDTRLEDNHPVMEFLEDIIYCPSQIEFYFRSGGQVLCLYIRQRHDETTAEVVTCYDDGEFTYGTEWLAIELSRDYDIEGAHHKSAEAEEQEIIAIETDCLSRLRTMYPDTTFPEHPNRRRGRYGKRLPDVRL